MTRKARPQPPTSDAHFAEVLSRAARSLGWMLPETPEEVALWEETEAHAEISARPEVAVVAPFKAEAESNLEEYLARAAREGTGEIAREVEERMRHDREEAERKLRDPDSST